jgi:hypothetical protein
MRQQPYSLAFADPRFEGEAFPLIEEEAERIPIRTSDPEQFLQMRGVAPVLRDVLITEQQTAVEQFGPLLFQAYHFWRFGKQVFAPTEPVLRSLLGELPAIGTWELVPPAPAGYLQLPANLLWARVADAAPAEAIDGVFWTMVGENDAAVPPFPRLDLLVVLGLIARRPGFSIAELSIELPGEPQGHWGDAQARESGTDFTNILPGGELKNYLGLETSGEVLKLISRCFWYVAQNPTALELVTEQRTDGHG